MSRDTRCGQSTGGLRKGGVDARVMAWTRHAWVGNDGCRAPGAIITNTLSMFLWQAPHVLGPRDRTLRRGRTVRGSESSESLRLSSRARKDAHVIVSHFVTIDSRGQNLLRNCVDSEERAW